MNYENSESEFLKKTNQLTNKISRICKDFEETEKVKGVSFGAFQMLLAFYIAYSFPKKEWNDVIDDICEAMKKNIHELGKKMNEMD